MINIGDIQTFVSACANGKFVVLVKQFKFDNIRQEAYWVSKEVREFRTKALAEAYASRVTK